MEKKTRTLTPEDRARRAERMRRINASRTPEKRREIAEKATKASVKKLQDIKDELEKLRTILYADGGVDNP